jgi:hypothetical protein
MPNNGTVKFRLTIVNANTALMIAPPTRFDIYTGSGHAWLPSPGALLVTSSAGSSTGHAVVSVAPGNYTIFGLISTSPTPNNGIGSVDVQVSANADNFYVLWIVPRALFTLTTSRAVVLNWQSALSGLVFLFVVFFWNMSTMAFYRSGSSQFEYCYIPV